MIGTIEKRMEFASRPDMVWRALTVGQELAQWFPDTRAFDLKPGAEGVFTWENHGEYAVRVEVFEPPSRLAWRWVRDAGTEIDGGVTTLVEFTLSPREGGGTILDLRESGFLGEEHLTSNAGGWDQELGHLQTYLEAG